MKNSNSHAFVLSPKLRRIGATTVVVAVLVCAAIVANRSHATSIPKWELVSGDSMSSVTGSVEMTQNGKNVRTAGGNIKVTPASVSKIDQNVVVHTPKRSLMSSNFVRPDTIRFDSFGHADSLIEGVRIEVQDDNGDVLLRRRVYVHADANSEPRINGTQRDVTPQQLIQYAQETQASVTQETMKVQAIDVVAGCVLDAEGRSSFSIRIQETVNGQSLYTMRTVQITTMSGCESKNVNDRIYAEFSDVNFGGYSSAVNCPDRLETTLCVVHDIVSPLDAIKLLTKLKEDTGNAPIKMANKKTSVTVSSGKVMRLSIFVAQDMSKNQGHGLVYGFIIGAIIGGIAGAAIAGPAGAMAGIVIGGVIGGAIGFGIGSAVDGCYPALSFATTPLGSVPMSQIHTGDKVLSFNEQSGELEWSFVYMQGHADGDAMSMYYSIRTENHRISASAQHFIPIIPRDDYCECTGLCGNLANVAKKTGVWKKCVRMTRAQRVQQGDWIFATHDGGQGERYFLEQVEQVYVELLRGLFNPYTMSGTIVVNGVIGSVHSEWLLEQYFSNGVPLVDHYVPRVYQAVMFPMRVGFRYCPKCMVMLDEIFPDGLCGKDILAIIKHVLSSLGSA